MIVFWNVIASDMQQEVEVSTPSPHELAVNHMQIDSSNRWTYWYADLRIEQIYQIMVENQYELAITGAIGMGGNSFIFKDWWD